MVAALVGSTQKAQAQDFKGFAPIQIIIDKDGAHTFQHPTAMNLKPSCASDSAYFYIPDIQATLTFQSRAKCQSLFRVIDATPNRAVKITYDLPSESVRLVEPASDEDMKAIQH